MTSPVIDLKGVGLGALIAPSSFLCNTYLYFTGFFVLQYLLSVFPKGLWAPRGQSLGPSLGPGT